MNIAIVIGVSDYGGQNNLPGCKNDAEIVYSILKATNKYDEVLLLTQNWKSHQVKKSLVEFFEKYQNKEIEEVFFYFSGHGDFVENEFYFLLSDYSEGKRKTTCLQNREVDEWIKSIKPNIAVKFVDACHSGVTYVKDNSIFKSYLQDQQKHFNICYFMFSSKVDQVSYQRNGISDFTKSFIEAIKNHPGSEIRYKEIIDSISDDFEANFNQTPFFIIQADFLQKFGTISDNDKKRIFETPINERAIIKSEYIELVKKESERFCSKQDILDIYNELLELDLSIDPEFESLYDIDFTWAHSINDVPKKTAIGKWLKENQNNYFASSAYEEDEPVFDEDGEFVGYETRISGFNIDFENLPFHYCYIKANAKFPILHDYGCCIVPVFSKTNIRFFYFFSNYYERDWDTKYLNNAFSWKTVDIDIKPFQNVKKLFQDIILNFELHILKAIKDKYNDDDSSSNQNQIA